MATAPTKRRTGRTFPQGEAALTKYAIARPKHWAVMNGCQNGRVSSTDKIAAYPVLIARMSATVCQETPRQPATTGSHQGIGRSPDGRLELVIGADCTRGSGPILPDRRRSS